MKTALLSLLLLLPLSSAHALPNPNPPKRNFELMKCVSIKHGTLWASFGHQWRSDVYEPIYFPTEIVVFASDLTSRLLFPDFREGLKIPVIVRPTSVRMEFKVPFGDTERTHLLQISQYDPKIDNGYLGTWTVSVNGKESADQVGCSLD